MAKDTIIELTQEQTELFVPLFLQSLRKIENIQLELNKVEVTSNNDYIHHKVYYGVFSLDSDDITAFSCKYSASYNLNTDAMRGAVMGMAFSKYKHQDNDWEPSEDFVSITDTDNVIKIDNFLVALCKQNAIEITPATVLKAEKLAKQQKAFNNFINTAFGQTTVNKQIELLKLANQMIKDSVIFVNKSAKDVEEHKQEIRKKRRGVFFFTKKR
ncbi:MAG: hypothetical protein J5714_01810 [Alphaproteobacteria bacterium]|nr:hypothetical protein [Alphaproteobacteria bacterium]